jgi:hypothetical protein
MLYVGRYASKRPHCHHAMAARPSLTPPTPFFIGLPKGERSSGFRLGHLCDGVHKTGKSSRQNGTTAATLHCVAGEQREKEPKPRFGLIVERTQREETARWLGYASNRTRPRAWKVW